MTVQDDGIGFDPSSALSRGLGLIGMEERSAGTARQNGHQFPAE